MQPQPFVTRRGSGDPMFLLHGNGVDHRYMLPLEAALEGSEWERIYLDLPGFGQTPALGGCGGAQDIAEWLVGVVREIAGSRPLALVGTSFGGILARYVAAHCRDQLRGMALLCPVVDLGKANRTTPEPTILSENRKLREQSQISDDDWEEYANLAVMQTEENWTLFHDYALPGIRLMDKDAAKRLDHNYALDSTPEDGTEPIAAPTLIITGRQDHVVGWADHVRLLQHYPRASFAVLDGAGHLGQLDRPEIVNAMISEWVERMILS